MSNFDIKTDLTLIAAGTHFWCSGHLSAVPIAEQSSDPRYCVACFNLLTAEVKLLREQHNFVKASWMPTAIVASTPPALPSVPQQAIDVPETHDTGADKETGIPKTRGILSHRGRGKKAIPLSRIKELDSQGLSSRDIAKQLSLKGIKVSYRTVSRTLAGVQ